MIAGWIWLAGYVLAMVVAVVFCAGIEKKCGLDVCPWEGAEAANDNPPSQEIAR